MSRHIWTKAIAGAFALALGLSAPALGAPKGPTPSPTGAVATDAAAPPAKARSSRHRRAIELRGVVNLNDADQATLELLPGVGEVKAKRIVDHRRGHPFRRVEDLARVSGFGRKTLARLKPYLAITGPSTLGEVPPPAP
jgi:competence protein ComEA